MAAGESRLATLNVTMPGMPELFPNKGLPQVGQKLVITLFPLSAFHSNPRTLPLILIAASGTSA
jgi:hypothetical protein